MVAATAFLLLLSRQVVRQERGQLRSAQRARILHTHNFAAEPLELVCEASLVESVATSKCATFAVATLLPTPANPALGL